MPYDGKETTMEIALAFGIAAIIVATIAGM